MTKSTSNKLQSRTKDEGRYLVTQTYKNNTKAYSHTSTYRDMTKTCTRTYEINTNTYESGMTHKGTRMSQTTRVTYES